MTLASGALELFFFKEEGVRNNSKLITIRNPTILFLLFRNSCQDEITRKMYL